MSNQPAPYAVTESNSRGRQFITKHHPYRSDFERDRDRVIHCEAFRRLEGKTQVFTPGINDNYRNRLTHSIEVAQIGRTIAKALRVNESLTEAICLAHDIGHSPFGHAGEAVLDRLTADFGGFEHNCQALRIVDLLEHPYPDFAGLNLMYETRLGLARHSSPYDKPGAGEAAFGEANCTLEGQIADVADRIAYNCHDLEDGTRARLINDEQLKDIKLFAAARGKINAGAMEDYVVRRVRTAKAIIDILVSDCIETSRAAIEKVKLNSPQQACDIKKPLVTLSGDAEDALEQLEKFLLRNLYLHKSIKEASVQTGKILCTVFERLCKGPEQMPGYFRNLAREHGLERTVCDYIAGMTDRFCMTIFEEV